MFGASLAVGLTIIAIAIVLEWREWQGRADSTTANALDQRYLTTRRWLLRAIHVMLIIC